MINRSQALVLGFFAAAWVALVALAVAAPTVYESALRPPMPAGSEGEAVLIAGVTALLIVLGVGVVRRWRWAFWLVLIAFAAGVLRVPASLLQLAGTLPRTGPAWYEILQAAIGVIQLAVAVALLRGYRKAGVWGRF